MKSWCSGFVFLLAFLIKADAAPSKGLGAPSLSEEAKKSITSLANSIKNATLTSELNSAVSADDGVKVTDLLIQAAAGNVGGSEADWQQAEVIAIEINDRLAIIATIIGDGSESEQEEGPPRPAINLLPAGAGSAGGAQQLTLASMVPIRVAIAKLKTYLGSSTATQQQKDIYATLKAAYDIWQTQAQTAWAAAHATGSKPDLNQMFERNTVLAEAVRKAADDLNNSNPSFTALYDAIPQSRSIMRNRMAKLLDMYQGNLTATGIPELVTAATKVTEFRQKVLAEGGASTAMVNDMVISLTDVQDVITKNINTIDDRKKQKMLQKLQHWTVKMLTIAKAKAPYSDRLKAALNG